MNKNKIIGKYIKKEKPLKTIKIPLPYEKDIKGKSIFDLIFFNFNQKNSTNIKHFQHWTNLLQLVKPL